MNWIAAVASLTPLLIAITIGLRWLGKQIWNINVLLATQNEAIRWQNRHFDDLHKFDSSVDLELDTLRVKVADIERYLENQTPKFERPFVIRGRKTHTKRPRQDQ